MAQMVRRDRLALGELHGYMWVVIALVGLSLVYGVIQIGSVRPYLWPAGTGALLDADPAGPLPLMARPPAIRAEVGRPATVIDLAPGSPAATAGIRTGDVILSAHRDTGDRGANLDRLRTDGADARLAVWRDLYLIGVSGPVTWLIESPRGPARATLTRPPVWRSNNRGAWAYRHLGMLVQIVVFVGAAIALILLRSNDRTAALCALALAFSAVAGGGPLLGVESTIPILGSILTIFTWIAGPLAFPTIALAILYFPKRSPLLDRHPLLHALPLAAAAPMLALSLMTALYLTGVEAARDLAVWDAAHPEVYSVSFVAALTLNLAAIVEGVHRYRFNHQASERRRIQMAVYTAVPGVLAYALKDGLPIVGRLAGFPPPDYPPGSVAFLQALVLLPAFGLVYAVGVARVLGPRVVLRRSLQYALASRTLTVLAVLPGVALVLTLAIYRDLTIRQIVTGQSGIYLGLIAVSAAAFRYRDRARQWLDERFFREEYDARRVLVSLAGRVRFETNPADLASMVVSEIDAALHPEVTAILVSGVEDGRLTPVTVLRGTCDALPLDGGLVAMLRWSDEPLEIALNDPRSPTKRLPPDEQAWLARTGATLLIPIVGQDRSLIAVIVLGEKRSEEAYTSEDLELLATIAAQMALGFDVARLRLRENTPTTAVTTRAQEVVLPMAECPRCGRCEDSGTALCPADGTPMAAAGSIPRLVDAKYRIEQLLGRGGMGAVYRARDIGLDRLVAVKVVRAELLWDPEAQRRFRREAQIVARLQHPAIVSVFDFGMFVTGGAYLVMELVRGEDLRRVLLREGRLDSSRALPILSSVCAGIEAAHRDGVLHRDLKPENILLPGGDLAAKVLDFGVAKVMATDPTGRTEASSTMMTAPGTLIGTPAYMAPEQFKGRMYDARTDVFSLGVIAYEMLSGELPFGRGSFADVVLGHAAGARPMPPGSATSPVERAVQSAIEAEPDRRPPSAHAFARLLESAAGQSLERPI